MTVLFCVRPTQRNVGNDLIFSSLTDLLKLEFGPDTAIVSVSAQETGFSAAQVYDMNRFADGVVVGGGNLFENGQLAIDTVALAALTPPLMMIGVSHGRIYNRRGEFCLRTDSLAPERIIQLADKACTVLVRDHGSKILLEGLGVSSVEVGGCPTLYLKKEPQAPSSDDRVLVSIRHPSRMSVPPPMQWRVAEDLRLLIEALTRRFGAAVHLVCHDYKDLELASTLPNTPLLYFEAAKDLLSALNTCRLSITYRLHAFLPCLAYGTPSIHLSYDERGQSMVATAGMQAWDLDLTKTDALASTVMTRIDALKDYERLRASSQPSRDALYAVTRQALHHFAEKVRGASGGKRGYAA